MSLDQIESSLFLAWIGSIKHGAPIKRFCADGITVTPLDEQFIIKINNESIIVTRHDLHNYRLQTV